MPELQKGLILIELAHEGEGWTGDYDPSDPSDQRLLRFWVFRIEDDDHVQLEDASYCTRLPDTISSELQMKALEFLMDRIYEPASEDKDLKKLCEELSWIDLDWLEGDTNKCLNQR